MSEKRTIRVWLEEEIDASGVYVQARIPSDLLPAGAMVYPEPQDDYSRPIKEKDLANIRTHNCTAGCADDDKGWLCSRTVCDALNMWKLTEYQAEYRFIIESLLTLYYEMGEKVEDCETILEI